MSDFKKNDKGKLQWSLMPFEQLEDTVRVLMKGAEKYGRENWKNCDDVNRYKDALMRHVTAYIKGETNDPEDNLPHLAHAICNCLFLQYFEKDTVPHCEIKLPGPKVMLSTENDKISSNEETVSDSEFFVLDKNGTVCRDGDLVKVLIPHERDYLFGTINRIDGQFFINVRGLPYKLYNVVCFEKKEEDNEQKSVRCPSKEDD